MACSSGFCLSSMACPDSLPKHSLSAALEFRQLALPQSHSQVKGRRRQASVFQASSEDSSSLHNDELSSGDKQNAMNRRALVALLGIFAQASNLSRFRADGMPINESERIRQEMIQKLEARSKNPSAIVTPPESSAGLDSIIKGSVSNMESQQSDAPLKQALSPDFTTLASEPVTNESDLQTLPQDEESDGSLSGYLNTLGYLGSGVLGGLYWLERQAKVSSVLALQDLSSKLKAKEDAMVFLKEQLEGKLSEEKDQASQQYKKAKEEQEALSNELSSATSLTENLQLELGDSKGLVQNLQKQVESLQAAMLEAGKEKAVLEETLFKEQNKGKKLEDEIRMLNSEVDTKVSEINTLHSVLQDKEKASEDISSRLSEKVEALSHARRRIEDLEKEMLSINANLSLSETIVEDLRGKLTTAIAHGVETENQLAAVYEELNSVKVSSAQELQAVQHNLTSKVAEVDELTVILDGVSKESEKIKIVIGDLQEEICVLRQNVNEGNVVIEQLTGELDASLQELKLAKTQINTLTQDLNNAKESNNRLDRRILDVQQEAELNLTSFKQTLDHEQALSSKLNEELKKVKEDLDFSRSEAFALKDQFKKLEVSYEQLKKDFSESEEAVKATSLALTKEKEIAAANKKQLESTRRAIAEAKESIKFLRQDVEKAKIELDKMSNEIDDLRKELETATAKIGSLEIEKASLSDSMQKERMLSSTLKEKVNQVDEVLGKLSKEKEITTKRAKKLEGELASTKGEMLRMKKQVTTLDTALEEAKSRVQGLTENTQSQEQSMSASQISSEIHSVQTELSYMHKSLEDAGSRQAEAEAAIGSLQEVISQRGSAEDAVLVSPKSKHDREV